MSQQTHDEPRHTKVGRWACLASAVLTMGLLLAMPATDGGATAWELPFAIGMYFLAPLASALAVLNVPFVYRRPVLMLILATLAYGFGIMAFVTLAINMGRVGH